MMKVSTDLFRLQVIVNGRVIQEYRGPGGHTFVEGRQGSNFELELTNLTSRRLLAHPTVDGLSCMTGKEASKNDSEHGYVLQPYATSRIPGWRLSASEVAAFFFAGAGKSYAEQKGRGADKGVIACAVWEEVYYPTWICSNGILRGCRSSVHPSSGDPQQGLPFTTCYHSQTVEPEMAKSMSGMSVNCCASQEEKTSGDLQIGSVQNLGTGFGERSEHRVVGTSFEPATDEPFCVAVVYYDDLAGLRSRGLKIGSEEKAIGRLPNPFPKDKETGCEPPDNWEKGDTILSILVQTAIHELLKRKIPVECLRIPRRARNMLTKEQLKTGLIFGCRFDFCDGDEIIAESAGKYGKQTAKVEIRH